MEPGSLVRPSPLVQFQKERRSQVPMSCVVETVQNQITAGHPMPIDRSELVREVGEEVFRQASSEARKAAPKTGKGFVTTGFSSNIPHEISDSIWESDSSPEEQLEATLWFYEEMPCYGWLMYISLYFNDLAESGQQRLLEKYAQYLSSDDDAVAEPAAYSLWCDFFENVDRVRGTWGALLSGSPNDLLVRRILESSGPVPFDLKEELYERLLPHERWHPWIFKSLLHSHSDVYGEIDKVRAKAILGRLRVPETIEHFGVLKEALK